MSNPSLSPNSRPTKANKLKAVRRAPVVLLMTLLLGVAWVGAFAASERHAQVDDDRVADLLGLEPSEYGRLLAENRLFVRDSDLQLALHQVSDRPFRLLPQRPSLRVARISGTVERIVQHTLPNSTADLGIPSSEPNEGPGDVHLLSIYECLVRPDEAEATSSARSVRILTQNVPALWTNLPWQTLEDGRMEWQPDAAGPTLHASALVFGLGEKRLEVTAAEALVNEPSPDTSAEAPLPTGITKRIEWPEKNIHSLLWLLELSESRSSSPAPTPQPTERTRSRQSTAQTWAMLGSEGFDLGLWDSLAKSQRRPLLASDNEPFYQLLRASSKFSPPAATELPLTDLIRQPQQLVGQSFRIHATIKQVTRVPSEADDRATQLGITEYFLLHGVIQLPRPLRLKFDEKRQITYQQHFPIVIATTKLPEGLAVGDDVRQWVNGDGLLFKLWSYQSLRSQEAGVDQWAPLLVSSNVQLSGPPAEPSTTWPISGLLLIPVGAGLLFLLIFGLRGVGRRS
ncbi:MAG: hypothetical protein Q8M16_23705 [Pirellulaceae bacterium]|nr:hypothetical protein [Pirellulaceae bacterium]